MRPFRRQLLLLSIAVTFLLPNLWHVCEHHFMFQGVAQAQRARQTSLAQPRPDDPVQTASSEADSSGAAGGKHNKTKRCSCNASPSHLTAVKHVSVLPLPSLRAVWSRYDLLPRMAVYAQVEDNRLPPATGPPA